MKRAISRDDIQFLNELQHKMKAMEHKNSANPKFWIVAGSSKVYTPNKGQEQSFELYDCINKESVADGYEESFDYIKNVILPVLNSSTDSGIHYKFESKSTDTVVCITYVNNIIENTRVYTIEDLIDWINKSKKFKFKIVYYKYAIHIQNKQVDWNFERQKQYPDDSCTYAMTALSCSELEELGKFLQEVDFNKLESLLVQLHTI